MSTPRTDLPTRVLGRTGQVVPVLGFTAHVTRTRRHRPLGPAEAAALEDEGRRLAGLWGPTWGR